MRGPDVAGDYARGLALGVQVSGEQQRLQAENTRTQMEAQARAATLKREQTMQQQELATRTAYQQAQIGLKKQQLDQIAQMNAAKTKAAAAKLQDQHGFASDIAGGMNIEQALFRHPTLSTPQAAIAAHKDALDLGQQRLDLSRQRLEDAQQNFQARQNKPQKIGTQRTTTTDPSNPNVSTATERDIFGSPGGLTPPKAREAVGKYKIGAIYKGGLKYLGGDPKDEDSWEKVKQ